MFLKYNKIRKSFHKKSSEYPMYYKYEHQIFIKTKFDFPVGIFFLLKIGKWMKNLAAYRKW